MKSLQARIPRAKFFKYIAILVATSLFCILSTVILRVILIQPGRINAIDVTKDWEFVTSDDESISRLRQILTYKTIADGNHQEEFVKLKSFLRKSFPVVHSSKQVKLTTFGNSLLYHIPGSNPDLKPYLLAGHLDVVPVEENNWSAHPFAANLTSDGYVYARGAIDIKFIITGILEAVEHLLNHRFVPKRGFYLAFGEDEEVFGIGASKIARHLMEENIKLEFLLDEGIPIFPSDIFSLKTENLAIISVTEKGYLTLNLTVNSDAGHSSMNQDENAAVILSRAVSKLNGNCHPNEFGKGPEYDMIASLAPHAKFPAKIVYANLWLFRYLVGRVLELFQVLNPLSRTTTAVTMLHSGYAENVIPSTAWAIINHRIHSSSSTEEVLEFTKHLIGDERISISIVSACNPHPISPYGETDFGYQTIKNTVEQIYDSIAVIPGVFPAATDTKSYLLLTSAVYRMSPLLIPIGDLKIIHGHDERILIGNYKKVIQYYYQLIMNADKPKLSGYRLHSSEL